MEVINTDALSMTPAPWRASKEEFPTIYGPIEKDVPLFEPWLATPEDAIMVANLRNAYDVQMRRGWGTYPTPQGKWVVAWRHDDYTRVFVPRGLGTLSAMEEAGHQALYDDPIIALIETEKWYASVLEKPITSQRP